MNEAIFNATVLYYQIYGEGSTTGRGKKPQLLEKIENWKKGVVVAKGTRTRHVLPAFIDSTLQTLFLRKIAMVLHGYLRMWK